MWLINENSSVSCFEAVFSGQSMRLFLPSLCNLSWNVYRVAMFCLRAILTSLDGNPASSLSCSYQPRWRAHLPHFGRFHQMAYLSCILEYVWLAKTRKKNSFQSLRFALFWHGYVLHENITYKSRVPRTSQMTSRFLRHTAAAMRTHVLCNSYNTRPLLCARITCYVTVIM
jgi:hypothetical protein